MGTPKYICIFCRDMKDTESCGFHVKVFDSLKMIFCNFKASLGRGEVGDMGRLWGECGNRREMILSVHGTLHIGNYSVFRN